MPEMYEYMSYEICTPRAEQEKEVSRMAAKGWRLVAVTGYVFWFERLKQPTGEQDVQKVKHLELHPKPRLSLSQEQRNLFKQWVLENLTGDLVPDDEGNQTALLYNIIHWIERDNQRYNYQPEQDKEIEAYGW